MKTILVPVEPNDQIDSTLQAARLLAATFGSYVEGFALTRTLGPIIAPDTIGGALLYDTATSEQGDVAREARAAFEPLMADRAGAADAGPAPTFAWLDDTPRGDSFVGTYGRVFDVTVLGRPGAGDRGPRMSTLEAALFESGRPVLIAPPAAPPKLGETITIAWNHSAETARTIAFALPLIKRARRVQLATIEGGNVIGPSGEELARYLERNGVRADIVPIQYSAKRAVGLAILDKAGEFGSDLLVKGAFTQSRVSQMIFGGATRDILAEAALPVFMAH